MKMTNKYFSPSNVEWYNSIYLYNKNNTKSLPILDNVVLNFIRIYFNMYNIKSEKSVRLDRLTKRKRWLSSVRKLWVGKLNLKHTNDKIVINIFIYDRINNVILIKLRQLIKNFYTNRVINLKNKNFINSASNLNIDTPINKDYNNLYKLLVHYLRKTNVKFNDKLMENIKNLVPENLGKFNNPVRLLINSINIKFLKKILKQEMNLLYYKKFVWLNTLKYKNTLLSGLQTLIGKIYNKKVVLNIIALKNFYLNSHILTQILIHKSKDRNRRVYNLIGDILSIVEAPVIRKNMISKVTKSKYLQRIVLKDNTPKIINTDLDIILNSYYNNTSFNTEGNILNALDNKSIIGLRLEAAGRLTKRFTAQRAIKKVKYIGTLKNVDSSFKGIPAQMLRNNRKNNIQFSKVKSQNRIGSFGIKGWINSI